MEKRLVKIGDAAAMLGVAVSTLRKWESTGELLPARKTAGGTRYYDANQLQGFCNNIYAFVRPSTKAEYIALLDEAIRMAQELHGLTDQWEGEIAAGSGNARDA